MPGSVLRRAIADRRRGLLGWGVGIVLLVAFTLAFYPSLRDNPELERALEQLPDALRTFVGEHSVTSPVGYLESQLFLYTVPVLFLVYGIGHGSDAIAGEEQRHTLDLLLAHPVTRRRVVIEKFAALVVRLTLLAALFWAALWAGCVAVGLEIGAVELAAASAGSLLLALVFAALSLALGCLTASRALANGISAAVATLAYFLDALAPQVDALEGVAKVSPFYLYLGSSPLENGFAPGHFAVLALVALALLAVAIGAFERRDVSV